MLNVIQDLWDRMRSDLQTEASYIQDACELLLSEALGPLTQFQREDLESVQRSVLKLERRIQGEPIDWADFSVSSHALRGPLNAMIGFSRVIIKGVDGPTNPDQIAALEIIYDNSRKLLALFNLLLDALMFTQDDLVFKIEPLPLEEILKDLTTVGGTLAEKRNFDFEIELAVPRAGITIRSDKKRLKGVLLGLMAVSAKYITEGTTILRVSASGEYLNFELHNQSCLLPPSLWTDPSALLTTRAPSDLPYDVQLRVGLAWRFMHEIEGRFEAQQDEKNCTFGVLVPLVS